MQSPTKKLTEEQRSIVKKNLYLAKIIARSYAKKLPIGIRDKEDLESEAILGLIDAAQKYEADRTASFKTYARMRIKGAITDYLREQMPKGYRERGQKQIRKLAENGLSAEKISEKMGKRIPTPRIQDILTRPEISHVSLFIENEGGELITLIPTQEETAADPEKAVKKILEIAEKVTKNKEHIAIFEKKLRGEKGNDIGKNAHVTESRISQIYRTMETRVKKFLEKRGITSYEQLLE